MKTCWKCGGSIKNGEAIKCTPRLALNDHGMIKCCDDRYFHINCYRLTPKKEREDV